MKSPALIAAIALLACTLPSIETLAQEPAVPDSLPPGVTAEMVKRGYTVFHGEGMCVNCHGALASGMLGPNLGDSDWWHAKGSYLSIIRQVDTGTTAAASMSGEEMPPRGGADLTDNEVFAVSAYVWTLSHRDAESLPLGVTAELVDKGGKVFLGKGNCTDCHGDDAAGNTGPDLTDDEWLHAKGSYLAIVRQILMGVTAEKSRSGVIMPPRGGSGISDSDVHSVAAYVWAISRHGE